MLALYKEGSLTIDFIDGIGTQGEDPRSIEDRHYSKIRGCLLDIQGESKQSPVVSAVISMAYCETFCLKTK